MAKYDRCWTYFGHVCLSAHDVHCSDSLCQCLWVVVGTQAPLQPRAAAEANDTNASQLRTDTKRGDKLRQETFDWDVPVIIATTRWRHNARWLIHNDSDVSLLRATYTHKPTIDRCNEWLPSVSHMAHVLASQAEAIVDLGGTWSQHRIDIH